MRHWQAGLRALAPLAPYVATGDTEALLDMGLGYCRMWNRQRVAVISTDVCPSRAAMVCSGTPAMARVEANV